MSVRKMTIEEIKKQVAEYSETLRETMLECGLDKKETNHRYNRLKTAEEKPGSPFSPISSEYYQIAHEIKCIQFLYSIGEIKVSKDHRSEPGCDCTFKKNYQVEFVCSSGGTLRENKLVKYCGLQDGWIEYGDKETLLLLRITSSLADKKEKHKRDVNKNVVSETCPFIIFLGLGELAPEIFTGEYGIEICGVLLGKGRPTFLINTDTLEVVRHGFEFRGKIKKSDKTDIDANIWTNPEYSDISAIIVTDASLYETYDTSNTWMFINPFAKRKILKKDFKGLVYWKEKDGEYFPCKNGRRLK